ncbi:MAG: MgtC/SapB family protein [Oscillospiraceae bacterium]|nr:MgtC/SapB family protein [Oscillospiraceae bacterium]
MTFYERLSLNFTILQWAELMLRIITAAACGWLVGVERSRRFKDAGVRTHCMVACSAALMMIVSKYGFADLELPGSTFFAGVRGADPSRIASQIVTGVGFLGAGIIYRDRKLATKGLTTAAGVWAVCGIGMALGAGMYEIGVFATLFIICLQYLTHRFNIGADRYSDAGLEINFSRDGDADEALYRKLEEWGAIVTDTQIDKQPDGSMKYRLGLKLKKEIKGDVLNDFVGKYDEVVSIKMTKVSQE